MTQYQLTSALKELINNSSIDSELKSKLISQEFISHTNLINFYKQYKPTSTLLELIKLTKLHIPNKNISTQVKTKEYLKLMQKLRLQAQEEEYNKLINPTSEYSTLYDNSKIDPSSDLTPAQFHKEVKNQITTIVNILISVASVAYAVWYWTGSSWGLQDSYRVLMSLFFGILVLVAEVVVYLGYLNKVEDARIRERNKKEVKNVVRTVVELKKKDI
ncbi:VPH2 [[Candida] subhashii]|uniref:VPH2 n=1 Tax=[Candida] subhashii TaxID=561895 RepID=A0A8J5QDI6_9ASCO|nr:VPH2 [[Candida] subhashii]KAG7660718.1 VPH2 [[Candida] subhashii]